MIVIRISPVEILFDLIWSISNNLNRSLNRMCNRFDPVIGNQLINTSHVIVSR